MFHVFVSSRVVIPFGSSTDPSKTNWAPDLRGFVKTEHGKLIFVRTDYEYAVLNMLF